MDKVYLAMCSDSLEYGDSSFVMAAFTDREMAEKYCSNNNEIDAGYTYYVKEQDVIKEYDLSSTVRNYYSYFASKDPFKSLEELWYDYREIKEWLEARACLNLEELQAIEETDYSCNDVGAKIYKDCLEYICRNVSSKDKRELEEMLNSPEYINCNDDEPEKRIYTHDIVIEEDDMSVCVYSVNSFEEAKRIALEHYNAWKMENR